MTATPLKTTAPRLLQEALERARAVEKASLACVFNVLQSLQGGIDPLQHGSQGDGWRLRGLPRVQD